MVLLATWIFQSKTLTYIKFGVNKFHRQFISPTQLEIKFVVAGPGAGVFLLELVNYISRRDMLICKKKIGFPH